MVWSGEALCLRFAENMCGAGSRRAARAAAAGGRAAGFICLCSLFLIEVTFTIPLPPKSKGFLICKGLPLLSGLKYRLCSSFYDRD